VHASLDHSAARLSLGLSEFLGDRVATQTFWVAPGLRPVVVLREAVGTASVYQTEDGAPPIRELQERIEQMTRVPSTVNEAIVEPLGLLATARGLEPSWRRFTLGWAALERLARNVGARFDDSVVVEQRLCPSCGADVTDRTPSPRRRLEALLRALELPDADALAAELLRINELRGRSHGGDLPDGTDLVAPERLASTILRSIVDDPGRVDI
jgi:hypothetical protein